MGQKVQYEIQPRLSIHMGIGAEFANYVVMKLLEIKGGPTFTMRTREEGAVDLWVSKRTYDALKAILAEAQERGEF